MAVETIYKRKISGAKDVQLIAEAAVKILQY